MNNYDAIGMAEGFIEASEEDQLKAWQHLIDTGICWQLQGWFGRTAIDLITAGLCTAPEESDESRVEQGTERKDIFEIE